MTPNVGLRRRMSRLLPGNTPAIWHPIDDGLISGPGTTQLRNLRNHFAPDLVTNLDAVIGFTGSLRNQSDLLIGTPTILNATASTTLGNHTRKMLVASVDQAIRLDASAIAYHINFTSDHENEMLAGFAQIVDEASLAGLPVVAMAYARRSSSTGADCNYFDLRDTNPKEYTRLIQHAVRAAVELGASAVKTTYTGSVDTFVEVVESAGSVPVLIAGEALQPEHLVLERTAHAVEAGAAGVAFGRQIFERVEPVKFVHTLRESLGWPRTLSSATPLR